MTKLASALTLLVVLAVVGYASFIPRSVAHTKLAVPGIDGWTTHDADSLYHVRRLGRALEEGTVASEDPFLNFPEGARIPWPPYYTFALEALITADLPEDPDARRQVLEMRVASTPIAFGILTSLLAALLGWRLAGLGGAAAAGTYHALCLGSVAYSRVGNGDHHAWISMLLGVELLLFTWIAGNGFASARRSTVIGLVAGALAGLMLGSWVAALLYLLALQLALGWFLFVHARRPLPGLPAFGFTFHVAALAVALPAILGSPWKSEFPWMVVNLSWFHFAHLALGGLLFVPLLASSSVALRRRFPWIATVFVGLLAASVLLIDAGPGRGVREGFEWVSRADEFMSGIQESRPLVGPGTLDPSEVFQFLGLGITVFPLAFAALAFVAFVRKRDELVPLAVALPPLALQAASQVRFSDAFSLSLSVLLAWALMGVIDKLFNAVLGAERRGSKAAIAASLWLVVGFAVAGAAQKSTAIPMWQEWRAKGPKRRGPVQRRASGIRSMIEWIRTSTPDSGEYCVLANWSQGHAIEWGAERPTVATNFGSYVGRDSFLDPSRFFLSEDPSEARAVLDRRQARYVLVTSKLTNSLPEMIQKRRSAAHGPVPLERPKPQRQARSRLVPHDGRAPDVRRQGARGGGHGRRLPRLHAPRARVDRRRQTAAAFRVHRVEPGRLGVGVRPRRRARRAGRPRRRSGRRAPARVLAGARALHVHAVGPRRRARARATAGTVLDRRGQRRRVGHGLAELDLRRRIGAVAKSVSRMSATGLP